MPVFLEFLLIAAVIYLWESALWLPKRGHALRRALFGKIWRVIPATRFLSTREVGVVPMLPIPPDSGLVPCPGFPLTCDDKGNICIETADGDLLETDARSWDQIGYSAPRLHVGSFRVRCQSHAVIATLRECNTRGLNPQEGILRALSLSLSPFRAKRDLKRWKIATSSLRFYCPLLTLGFFAGIPALYIHFGPESALWLAAWLWILMLTIGFQLLWLGKSVYPASRKEISQDALLSMFVPFHAMRALEITSVHAFPITHPAAILLTTESTEHPWLRAFIRSLLFPRSNHRGDATRTSTLLPIVEKILVRKNLTPADFNTPPNRDDDRDASAYCPRCHGMFLKNIKTCSDCRDIPLKVFSSSAHAVK